MIRRIIWSSMVWPAYLSIFGWLLFDTFEETAELLSWVAGCWAGTLSVWAAFWRFGWGRSAGRQLCLWGFVVVIGAIVLPALFFAVIIADVLPMTPTSSWLNAYWMTFGLGVGLGLSPCI